MTVRVLFTICVLGFFFARAGCADPAPAADLTALVDPFVGTAGGGNTFPGPSAPFGMVQFSPDTAEQSVGYTLPAKPTDRILGFSLTHMSGVGCADFGDVFVVPTTGAIKVDTEDTSSPFTHDSETASPGYYSVDLRAKTVHVELTATERCGLARFTFHGEPSGNILVPISHTLTQTAAAAIQVVGANEIDGSVTSQCVCGVNDTYTIYFVMLFDQAFSQFGAWKGDTVVDNSTEQTQLSGDPPIGAYVTFMPPPGTNGQPFSVTARIGISFVDLAGARANVLAEAGTTSFDDIRKQTAGAWNDALHLIDVLGGTPAQRGVFYTALYHSLLMPNVCSDVDGRYAGFDKQIHQAKAGHEEYTNFSGWDIYRTEAPLLGLIEPKRMQDMCQSITDMCSQGGWPDRWPQANCYTGIMCGSPLTTVVSQAWQYGLQHFDIVPAYDAMYKDATEAPPSGKPYSGEADIDDMNSVGYVADDHCTYGSVSQTEEDCIAYAALAPVADSLGRLSDSQTLQKRAMNYKNVFNTQTGFMQPRLADGSWRSPFDPTQTEGYVEGSGWHYLWLVPEDVRGLITLLGGDKAFNAKLDSFFADPKPEWTGAYYNPYNEPDLQAPFLYDWSGAPSKSQAQVRKILGEVYHPGPDGIPGNDDCGTMSAWAVLAMIGLYPADPTQPNFELCSPVFSRVALHLSAPHGDKTFTLTAPGTSDSNKYIQSARLNGDPLANCWVTQDTIASGGTLSFALGPSPSTTWAVGQDARPPSLSDPSQ